MLSHKGDKDRGTGSRWIEYLKGGLMIFAAGWLCFRSWIICLIGMVLLPLYLKYKRNEEKRKKQKALWGEFRDVTAILYSSTAAGGTMEKALRDARRDMRSTADRYPLLLPEFDRMCARLDRNTSMEDVLDDFAVRSKDEDIAYFVQILSIAKKSGGSLPDVIHHTAEIMTMRTEINSEIETLLAGKRGELKIMLVVPPAILIYMNLFSTEYMDVLYCTTTGRCIMAAALAVYGIAAMIGRKILDIRV